LSEIVRALLALQEEEGWLSPDGLEALAARLQLPLHRLESVSTFYNHFKRERPEGVEVEVCRDLSCRLAGAASACASLRDRAGGDSAFEIKEVSCLGRCDQAPAAAIGDRILDASDLEAVTAAVAEGANTAFQRSVRPWPGADPYAIEAAGKVAVDASEGVAYRALLSVLSGSREAPIQRLEAAGLRGMGGAGFPTARKWSLVAAESATPKHVVCNADESEPGTFKDREILHDLPHLVIEGMAIAAYCVGAERGTVFIRHEYGPERERLEAALRAARDLGALGNHIFQSDFSFDIDVFVSPGGYILGEETALLECMEGRRGEPRNKPPFPGTVGLNGRPTLINNVETLAHAVSIVHRGPDWWHDLGLDGFSGHKFISVSGDVAEPGVSLFPVGTPLSAVLAEHGGMQGGAAIGAVAPGGASSNFLGPEALDLALDFDALAEAGTMLGSGAVVFVAEDRNLLDVGLSITRFFRNESCGKCVPCRVGSEKAVALVEASGGRVDESLLRSLAETMEQTSICGLGQVALGPLLSILSRFPDRVRHAEPD
jgi:NADH:ubiquinone oxidoreductase subunit F (NADH-binding)/NADH:ubiquinone oxidoreductase subunit E